MFTLLYYRMFRLNTFCPVKHSLSPINERKKMKNACFGAATDRNIPLRPLFTFTAAFMLCGEFGCVYKPSPFFGSNPTKASLLCLPLPQLIIKHSEISCPLSCGCAVKKLRTSGRMCSQPCVAVHLSLC